MAKPEAAIENYLREQVEHFGGLCEKLPAPPVGRPDRLITWPVIGMELVETKAPNGEVSPMQERDHKRRRARNVTVYVIWTKPQVDEYICDAMQRIAAAELY